MVPKPVRNPSTRWKPFVPKSCFRPYLGLIIKEPVISSPRDTS